MRSTIYLVQLISIFVKYFCCIVIQANVKVSYFIWLSFRSRAHVSARVLGLYRSIFSPLGSLCFLIYPLVDL